VIIDVEDDTGYTLFSGFDHVMRDVAVVDSSLKVMQFFSL
jgi:hypothetical protein